MLLVSCGNSSKLLLSTVSVLALGTVIAFASSDPLHAADCSPASNVLAGSNAGHDNGVQPGADFLNCQNNTLKGNDTGRFNGNGAAGTGTATINDRTHDVGAGSANGNGIQRIDWRRCGLGIRNIS